MLDIFFLSYNEPGADDNFEILKLFASNAKRVNGITGIFNAHLECARQSNTSHFYIVDADAVIQEDFDFKFTPRYTNKVYETIPETECVFVWQSRNPINDLIYGYGGVKLFPKQKLLSAKTWSVDMATTIGAPFVLKSEISNITAFNTDPFNTWKSAFRECVKLSSGIIPNNELDESSYRLKCWCENGADRLYGKFALIGANQGKDFGLRYANKPNILNKINDFEWLKQMFDQHVNI